MMRSTTLMALSHFAVLHCAAILAIFAEPTPTDYSARVLTKIRRIVQPWQPVEESWVAEATMVFRSTYCDVPLPYIRIGATTELAPYGAEFRVVEVVKGDVRYESIITEREFLRGDRFPHRFVEGREYLVFVRPGERTLGKMMNKDAARVTLANYKEVTAVIDLSASKAEADALAVQSTKSGTYQGFQFTPDKWTSLRASRKIDLNRQKEFVPFLVNVVLTRKATLASVRSYLGSPNYEDIYLNGYEYHYDFNRAADSEDGQISGSLVITFSPDLAIVGYRIAFSRSKVSPGDGFTGVSQTILSAEEHRKLGLPLAEGSYRGAP